MIAKDEGNFRRNKKKINEEIKETALNLKRGKNSKCKNKDKHCAIN